jgi:hypothetical protein
MFSIEMVLWSTGWIVILWIVAFTIDFAGRLLWAWVDDLPTTTDSYILRHSKWRYPVYNSYTEEGVARAKVEGIIYGYAHDKKYDGSSINNLLYDRDYIYDFERGSLFVATIVFPTIALPSAVYLTLQYSLIGAIISCILSILFIARSTRRLSKKVNNGGYK